MTHISKYHHSNLKNEIIYFKDTKHMAFYHMPSNQAIRVFCCDTGRVSNMSHVLLSDIQTSTAEASIPLAHRGRMTHICVSRLTIIGSDNGFRLAGWNIVNWTPGNKLQWNLKWYLYIFIQECAFKTVVRRLALILWRLQCVKSSS